MTDEAAVIMRDARFRFRTRGAAPDFALHVADLRVESGETVLLVGPSGSGKSTLLNIVCGALPAEGTVRVLGEELPAMSGPRRDRFRARRLGVVFQGFNLVPYLTVMENVLLPVRLARAGVAEPKRRAHDLLAALGLPSSLGGARADRLSAGQGQRVAAARAFMLRPGLVVADEPTSALDADAREAFLGLLFAQARDAGAAVLAVSHDPALREQFDRTVELSSVVSEGPMNPDPA